MQRMRAALVLLSGCLAVACGEPSASARLQARVGDIKETVWDTRGQQNLHAVPGVLDSGSMRLTGTNLVGARGQLDLGYELQVSIGQPPYYINGPRRVAVRVHGRNSAGNPTEATAQN